MATRLRTRRTNNSNTDGNVQSPVINDDIEPSPRKQPVKTGNVRQNTKSVTGKLSLQKVSIPLKRSAQKAPQVKNTTESQTANNPTIITPKKGKKPKNDVHAFSTYFESKRGTVQYKYQISPIAQVCLPSQSPGNNQQSKPTATKKVQRKRKAGTVTDIFDYCSDEEVVIPTKKIKLASTDNTSKKTTKGNKTTTTKAITNTKTAKANTKAAKANTKTAITNTKKKSESQTPKVVDSKLPSKTSPKKVSPPTVIGQRVSSRTRRSHSNTKPVEQTTIDEVQPVKRGRRKGQTAGRGRKQTVMTKQLPSTKNDVTSTRSTRNRKQQQVTDEPGSDKKQEQEIIENDLDTTGEEQMDTSNDRATCPSHDDDDGSLTSDTGNGGLHDCTMGDTSDIDRERNDDDNGDSNNNSIMIGTGDTNTEDNTTLDTTTEDGGNANMEDGGNANMEDGGNANMEDGGKKKDTVEVASAEKSTNLAESNMDTTRTEEQGTEEHGTTGTEEHGTTDTEEHGTTGTEEHGTTGTEEHGTTGTEEHGTTGTEEHGTIGTEEKGTAGTEEHGTTGTKEQGTTEEQGTTGTEEQSTEERAIVTGQDITDTVEPTIIEEQSSVVPNQSRDCSNNEHKTPESIITISSDSSTTRLSLECSADLSLNETEETYKRKKFDHHLKVPSIDIPSLLRSSTWPKMAASTTVTNKKSLTVVRNVRQAHECLQRGENVQFRDQVEYLIDNIKPSQPLSIRCLSTLSLASECLKNDFCRQLRAHGVVYKIMMLLKDAIDHPSLQIAAVTLFFVISQDQIDGNDLDRTCLELLLGLMENAFDEPETEEHEHNRPKPVLEGKSEREYQKIKTKSLSVLEKCPLLVVREKNKGQATSNEDTEEIIEDMTVSIIEEGIKPTSLSICEMICECFYSITSPQSSCNWVKEEMRILGILDIIANRAIHLIKEIDKDVSSNDYSSFLKIIRIMKLLENVTFMNKSNQSYLTVFDGSILISKLCSCLVRVKDLILLISDNSLLCSDVLLGVLKILLNLTHDHELGSFRVGEQTNILQSTLECVFQIPNSFTVDRSFDLLVLSLGLLINLMEHSAPNRELLHTITIQVHSGEEKKHVTAVKAITELFLLNYKKSEEMTIDVPTPQNLSQRTPISSPMKASFSPSIKRDTSVPLASRLRIHKDVKGYRSPAKLKESEGIKEVDGLDWLPAEEEESETEEDNEPISDSLVFSREDFDTALTQAGRHMENSIIASYSALLLAVLAKYSTDFSESLKQDLPKNNYSSLLSVLKEFIEFMSMAGSGSTNRSGLDSIRKIVKHIETLQQQTIPLMS